jgi:hypothetical protein
VALALCACKDKGNAKATSSAGLDTQCQQLAKACGDNAKHVEKIVDECKQAATTQVAKGCTDKAIAQFSCYEKELCGKADKVWALDDLRVLAERQGKCAAERTAVSECVAK